jgi:hypothetical protein
MKKVNRIIQKLLLTLALFCGLNMLVSAQSRPNIIFFIADDMTTNMFNSLPEGKGKNLTPHIDRLANEGEVMMVQHVASTVYIPSRYNCLTGKYASRATNPDFLKFSRKNNNQCVVQWNTHIMPGEQNLVQLLKVWLS